MTREELINTMYEGLGGDVARINFEDTADRILAALAKEREGEVVLGSVVYHEREDTLPLLEWFGRNYENFKKIFGKRGQLIFRPAKGGE